MDWTTTIGVPPQIRLSFGMLRADSDKGVAPTELRSLVERGNPTRRCIAMRQWIACCFVAALFTLDLSTATAQRPAARESLLARLHWTDFEVVMGRVQATSLRHGQSRTATSGSTQTGCHEVVAFHIVDGSPAFRYLRTETDQRLQIDVFDHNQVEIRCELLEHSPRTSLQLTQPASGPLALVEITGDETAATRVTGDDLWHLLVAADGKQTKQICALLSFLRTDWRLEERAASIELALFDLAGSSQLPNLQRGRELVSSLASRKYAQRQAADRQLRAMGLTVLAIIDHLEDIHLDAEQRNRLRSIRKSVVVRGDDTPLRAATWMVGNPRVWLTLLNHDNLEHRIAAKDHLQYLSAQTFAYDPLADPDIRDRQILAIAGRLVSE